MLYALLILIALEIINAQQLRQLIQQGRKTMAAIEDFNTLLTAVDESTNNIAAEIEALKAQIGAGGMTAEQEADVLARLQAASDKLKALGSDPANPVPNP